jgi:hypothetical protein
MPGAFTNRTTGGSLAYKQGWRRFMATGANVTTEDPNSYLGSVVETSGNTVLTFAQSIQATGAAKKNPIQGWVAILPLTGPTGRPITFGKPFMLKTMIELISISGSYSKSNGDNKNNPQIAMGVGMYGSGVDTTANRHLFQGFRCQTYAAKDITFRGKLMYGALNTGGNGYFNAIIGARQTDYDLIIADWYMGPDLTGSNQGDAETSNFSVNYGSASDSSGRGGNVTDWAGGPNNLLMYSLNRNQGFNADTQVYLYLSLTDFDSQDNDGSNTPATLTCRFWYMVGDDMSAGWGGTGVA